MAAGGYPGPVLSGVPIPNLAQAPDDDLVVFQAGTAMVGGRTVTAGGRVLTVTAHGADIMAARAKAYAAVERLRWPGATWRRDIGIREVERRLARRA
jgi:phosphoribosylamine--glycine ligase